MRRSPRSAVLAILLALAFVLPGLPAVTLAQETAAPTAPASTEDVYVDPAGRFTVPIPTNWTVEEREGYVVFSDPEGDITVSAVVVEGTDAKEGILAAWAIVEPSFDAEHQPGAIEQEVPAPPGIDKILVITYDLGQISGHVLQAAGQVAGGHVYVLIFEGSLDAVTRRASQIQVLASGFKVTGVAETDLSGVAAKPFRGGLVSEFEAYVGDLMARTEVPGASVAVVQDGKVVYAHGFGVNDIGGAEPVTPDTLMMIGSTTKSMTTMMMATEVDDGLLRWDEPVVDILPSFVLADPELTRTITIRDLVCACTGVPRRDLELVFNADELTAEDVIASLRDFQVYTKFGEAFQYSNQMVATGGYVAAAAAGGRVGELGKAYERELRERVLDPIGMTRTTLDFAVVAADPDHATPHGLRLDYEYTPLTLAAESFVLPVAPAGAIWSSANEMARYLQTELSGGVAPDGTRIVSEANLAATWQPQVAVDAETGYGLGWFVGEYDGQKLIYHGGNTFGFTSDLAFLPDAGVGIVVLANAQGSTIFNEGVRHRLFELLFDQPAINEAQIAFALDQVARTKAQVKAQLADHADPAAVAPFLGRYSNDALGEVTLALDGDRLLMDAGEFTTELRPLKRIVPGLPGYLMFDPPLAGLQVELKMPTGDGEPQVVIWAGTDAYTLTLSEQRRRAASPVAAGSPQAAD